MYIYFKEKLTFSLQVYVLYNLSKKGKGKEKMTRRRREKKRKRKIKREK